MVHTDNQADVERVIKAVKFEYSIDGGEHWDQYKDGEPVPTGQLKEDTVEFER